MSTALQRSGAPLCDPTSVADTTALRDRIVERTEECLAQCTPLCRRYKVAVPHPLIRFDLSGRAAGQFVWQARTRPMLRFNLEIALHHADEFIAVTVAHEVAHLVTVSCHGRTRPHGPEWRAVMHHLGITNPHRCHDYRLDGVHTRSQRRWIYTCECKTHDLSTTRHNRVRRGTAVYFCRRCGSELQRGKADRLQT